MIAILLDDFKVEDRTVDLKGGNEEKHLKLRIARTFPLLEEKQLTRLSIL